MGAQEAPPPAAAIGIESTPEPVAPVYTSTGAKVPTYVDVVQRGARMRVDLGGKYRISGLPAPPVRLEVDDVVNETDDLDVNGVVMFGWDRPFDLPIQGDLFGDASFDVGGDSPVSPFLDDTSAFPRAHLYSAFIGLSPAPGDGFLNHFRLNIGRQTEIVESPITYDGGSLGAKLNFAGTGRMAARVWGGLDAPQHLADDPFSRIDHKSYIAAYEDDGLTGGFEEERTFNVDGVPLLNLVGGASVEAGYAGFLFSLTHNMMPVSIALNSGSVQRTILGATYNLDADWVRMRIAADLKASNFIPRSTSLKADMLTGDGTTRVSSSLQVQFLEDITAYDSTFRAFNFAANFDPLKNAIIEGFRQQDQIRHLNFGPPEPNVTFIVDAERELPASFSVNGRARIRQQFDRKLVDAFHTNVYDAALGATWSPGMALDVGAEVSGGLIDSGDAEDPNSLVNNNNLEDFDLIAEGVVNYVEERVFTRTALLDGRLSAQSEVFFRQQSLASRSVEAIGQFSTAFATTIRYNIFDAWQVSARLDADVLSPFDSLNASGYVGGMVATSVRF